MKEALISATHLLFMLKDWNWHKDDPEATKFNVRVWMRNTGVITFVSHMLEFCQERIDTYAELLKDMAVQFIFKLSYESDDG